MGIKKDENRQVEWRDNSATAYCREIHCDWKPDRLEKPLQNSLQFQRLQAQLHTFETGHDTEVDSTIHYIDEYERE